MTNKITIKNNVKIINDEYVIKKKKRDIDDIYNYLLSRSFDYFPDILKKDQDYIYYKYINDIEEPKEQKIIDLINLVSLLHNKTTFYKEVDIDYYKYIYESINKEIDDIYEYYNIVMDNIENEIYMSPSNYLIARNISLIYNALKYSKKNIDKWYKIVDNSRKVRVVMNHNNLSLAHYLKSDKSYLISFDKSDIGMPIDDLVILYKKHFLDFEFSNIFRIYLSKYPLSNSEMILFLTKISLPSKIEYNKNEYLRVINIRRIIDYVYKTSSLVTEYEIKD